MSSTSGRPIRIGIPHRTREEETTGQHDKIESYLRAVREAGAEAVPISLGLSPEKLKAEAAALDAFVLSGSPADVDPALFGELRHKESAEPDPDRERTDFALLGHAFAEHKPVLAICYGIQSLNVFRDGTLVQDIPTELSMEIRHDWENEKTEPEPFHKVQIDPNSRLAQLAGGSGAVVNSSHHQSVAVAGSNLKVVARTEDGVVEAVEWTGDGNWVMGVQWHPERMAQKDGLAKALFGELVAAAKRAAAEK
jgi:putative glutamine amidotransferase